MADDREQFAARLFGTFLKEAAGHVVVLKQLLADLEQTPVVGDASAALFREVHSLKGAAGAVEAGEVEFLCQSLEQLLVKAQRREVAMNAVFFDIFRQSGALFDTGLPALGRGEKFMIPLHFFESMRKLT